MKIINLNHNVDETISQVISVLKKDGLLILPSDTVYGLCADSTSEKAIDKLIAFKRRPPGKAISVFIPELATAHEYVALTEHHKKMLHSLLPGPFTIVVPSMHSLSKKLESEKGTLGIRIPQYEFIQKLVKAYGKPITATSANISGMPPHYSIESLLKTLSDKKQGLIDLIVDGGKLPYNKPSTVLDLTGSNIRMLRHGDVQLTSPQTYTSHSLKETKKIAHFLFTKYKSDVSKKPLIFLFMGDLGTGKTQFIKTIGDELGIPQIISPTYVIYYEYKIEKEGIRYLYHFDLYNIEEEEEFNNLGIDNILKPGNVVCIEWGEKAGAILEKLKGKGKVIVVKLAYEGETTRKIEIQE